MTRIPKRESAQQRETASSMYDELANDPRGRNELAAAELAIDVQAIIHRAFEESTMTARAVADLLGVTEGRVSQIRNGDGNVRISTLAKVMSALGKRVNISVTDTAGSRAPVTARAHERSDEPLWTQRFVSADGVHECTYEGPREPTKLTPLGEPEALFPRHAGTSASYVRKASRNRARHGIVTQAWVEV